MEKFYSSSIKINTGFGVGSRQPLDARTICEKVDDMNAIPDTRRYEGLVVYCEDVKKYFKYNGTAFVELSVEHVIDSLTSTSVDIGLSANQGRVLKEALDSLNTELQKLKQEVGDNDGEYNEIFTNIQNSINTINENITSLKQEDTKIHNLITALEGVDTALQKAIDELKTQHTTDVTLLKEKDTEQDGRLSAIENVNNTQNERLNSIETKNIEHDGSIKDLQDEDKNIKQSIEDLRDDVTSGAASSGKVKVDASDTTIDYLENKIIPGTADHQNGKFSVAVTKVNEKLNVTVEVPVPVWTKL